MFIKREEKLGIFLKVYSTHIVRIKTLLTAIRNA